MNPTNDHAVTQPSPEPGSPATSTSAAETPSVTAPPPSEQPDLIAAASSKVTDDVQTSPQTKKETAIAKDDLLLEGFLRVTGTAGVIFEFPVNLHLCAALSPALIPNAQTQFEMLINQLLVKPGSTAFIAYIEKIKTEQADAARRKKFAGQPA